MKNEKGITLTALVIYVLIFSATLALLGNLTNYIYPKLSQIDTNSVSPAEFNKFNSNFVTDVKESSSAVVENEENGNIKIIMSNGINYDFIKEENAIYRDKNKIAQKIVKFSAEIDKINNKNIIKIIIGTGKDLDNINFGKTIKYVLRYW